MAWWAVNKMPDAILELGSSTIRTITSPPGPGSAARPPHVLTRAAGAEEEAFPHYVQAAVAAEVTAHGVKRSLPAGPGPAHRAGKTAGSDAEGAGTPGRSVNAMQT